MRSIATLAILFFVKLLLAQNLIVNPSAEISPIVGNGWTSVNPGEWRAANFLTSHASAPGNTNFFYAGDGVCTPIHTAELYQDVDVSNYASIIDAGNAQFSFNGYTRNYFGVSGSGDDDGHQIIVEYRDVSGTVLTKFDPGAKKHRGAWTANPDIRIAPVGTRTIRIRLFSICSRTGDSDGYFDDLSLTIATPTPVSLLFFDISLQNNQALCTWQTANESNNKYFTIEKSNEGLYWDSIGSVEGRLNSNFTTTYEFIDPVPLERQQYYRLKQVDFTGHITYYPIQVVRHNPNTYPFSIYTNNVDQIVVKASLIQQIEIYNVQGQLYSKHVLQNIEEQFTLSNDLPSGSYIFRIMTDADIYNMMYLVR